jgi:TRAP-type transport system small permease protein
MIHADQPDGHRGPFWFVLLRIPEALLGILVAALVVFLTFSVFARYVFNLGLVWSDEVARLMFVWTVFLGFAVGLKHRGNIGVELIVDRLPPVWRRRASILQDAAILVFSMVFVWQAAIATKFSFLQRLPALQVSIAWLYFAVLIAAVLMVIYAAANLWETLRSDGPRDSSADAVTHF